MSKTKVIITDKQKSFKLPTGTRLLVRKACIATLKTENFNYDAEVDVTFVDDKTIQEINKEHRDIDASTDALYKFPE